VRSVSWLFDLAYRLDNHYLMQVSLADWVWVWVGAPPILALLRRLRWGVAILLSLPGVAVLLGLWLARKRGYLVFVPSPLGLRGDAGSALRADEAIQLWASGRFAVEGKQRNVVHAQALYSFVKTREHIVMVWAPSSRFLLLARSESKEAGYWYVFFHPDRVRAVVQGQLVCGGKSQSALAICYLPSGEAAAQETVYLSFDRREDGDLVLADLRVDAPSIAFSAPLSEG